MLCYRQHCRTCVRESMEGSHHIPELTLERDSSLPAGIEFPTESEWTAGGKKLNMNVRETNVFHPLPLLPSPTPTTD